MLAPRQVEQARDCAAEHDGIRATFAPYARPPLSPPSQTEARPAEQAGPALLGALGRGEGAAQPEFTSDQAASGSPHSPITELPPHTHLPSTELPQPAPMETSVLQTSQPCACLPTPTPPMPAVDRSASEPALQAALQKPDGPADAGAELRSTPSQPNSQSRTLSYQEV